MRFGNRSTVIGFAVATALGLATLGAVPAGAATTTATTTVIEAPNFAPLNAASTLIATVTANSGTTAPQGTVTFSTTVGTSLGAVALSAVGTSTTSTASVTWTPTSPAAYSIIATYAPSATSGMQASTSTIAYSQVPFSGPTVSIRLPWYFQVGRAATLTALTPWNLTGSVGFLLNGAGLGGSIPTVGGVASTTWIPTTTGAVTITANYTATNGTSGQSVQAVYVMPALTPDPMSIDPAGPAVWTVDTSATIRNGQSLALVTSSGSGSPVTLTETGPCTITGSTISVNTGTGVCMVTANSPGGGTYGPNTALFTVNVNPGQQTANLRAPASGTSIKVGKTVTIATSAGRRTNAGKTITWRVTKGTGVCSVAVGSTVRLSVNAKGSCTLRGTAPAVPGKWNAYAVAYTYRGV